MRKKRIITLIIALSMVLVLIAGCNDGAVQTDGGAASQETQSAAPPETTQQDVTPDSSEEPEEPATGEGYRIAYITKSLLDDFMINLKDSVVKYGEEAGCTVTVLAANGPEDVEGEIQIIDDVIMQKFDAIILLAIDSVAVIPSIKRANEAGIPVILVNDTIDEDEAEAQGAEYVTYIGTDNFSGGKMGGEYIAELYDEAKIAILGGIEGVYAGDVRLTGFKEGISSNAALEVVAEQRTDWSRDQGFSVMQNVLTANPELDVVFAASSAIGLGAMEAIQQAGRAEEVKVLNFDGTADDIAEILAGNLLGSVAQNSDQMALEGIQACLKAINGEGVDREIATQCEVLTKELLESR